MFLNFLKKLVVKTKKHVKTLPFIVRIRFIGFKAHETYCSRNVFKSVEDKRASKTVKGGTEISEAF